MREAIAYPKSVVTVLAVAVPVAMAEKFIGFLLLRSGHVVVESLKYGGEFLDAFRMGGDEFAIRFKIFDSRHFFCVF